ncbi:hypothetical protein AB5J56_00455 [Streptomyces sp. R21]|uniref:Uncharacterized protein n=1 Tax=Streptomyces sp. R21 TaxID=3238627 RepID=A0AB39P2G1_9ACTN
MTRDLTAFGTEITFPEMLQADAWTGDGPATGAPSDGWGFGPQLWQPKVWMRPEEAVDPGEWRSDQIGWGLVLPDRDDLTERQKATADDAPEPIRELFKQRLPAARIFRHRQGPATGVVSLRDYLAHKDVAISGSATGIGDGKLPQYLLLYGGPEALPWGLQYQLNAGRYVGRLHLTGDELDHYVTALLSEWKDSAARYDAPVIWSVDHGGDDISQVMRTSIGAKVAARMTQDRDQEMKAATYLDGGARPVTGGDLVAALALNTPALVVTTSHGMTGPLDDRTQMTANLGLLVDTLHSPLEPTDVLARWQPAGAIWYAHACCSAGADGSSVFTGLVQDGSLADQVLRGVAGIGPTVAPLPTALLGAAQPLRAFIGHVEPTFDWTIRSPWTLQPLTDNLVTALYDKICLGKPAGLAFGDLYGRIGELATAHDQAIRQYSESIDGAEGALTAATYTKLAYFDLQTTVILGDPTVAIRLPVRN